MSEPNLTRREAVAALSAGTALSVFSAPARALSIAQGRPASEAEAAQLLDSLAENLLRLSPESATSLGIDEGPRAYLRSMLSDRSGIGQQKVAQTLQADLARANAIDPSGLSHAGRTSVEVVRSAYATALEGFRQPYGDVAVGGWRNTPYVVIQNVGAYLDVPRFLDSQHQINDRADAEAYIARLQSYPHQLDYELGRVIMARYKGLIPPAFLIDKTLEQLRASAKNARAGGTLVESIERRTREKGIAGNWAEQARAITTGEVAPALERQIAEFERQRPQATDEAGMWARPHGDDYYRWALKASTTTTLSPEEIHQIGLSELEQIHGRMDGILDGIGYTEGTVGQRMQALAKDPEYQFSEGDKGRAEIMAFIQDRLTWIEAQMPRAFNTLVDPNMEVKRLPPEEEPGAPRAYGGAGSIDGSIPGRFWINLRTPDLHRKYDLADLAYHEAIPGHIWQGEYTHKLPLIRQLLAFNAYSEGWALYAEQLADELGAYEGDPAGRLGFLQSLAFRAIRLIVDTGLHAKRWTREQGVRYFVEVNGSNPKEVASEVDRYCSWPGQACGYKIGHNEILRQRQRAKTALGTAYDLKAFDDAVVLGGNVPMDVLEKNVGDYIADVQSGAD